MFGRLRILLALIFGVLLAGALLGGVLSHRATPPSKTLASSSRSPHATHDLRKVKTGWSALKANLRHDERSSRTMMCDDADDDDDDDAPDLSTPPRSDDGDDVRADARAETVAPCEPRELPAIEFAPQQRIRPAPGHDTAMERPPRA